MKYIILGVLVCVLSIVAIINSNKKVGDPSGILTKLPPWSEEELDMVEFKPRNIYSVIVNSKNELLVRNQPMEISDLKNSTKKFITNPNKNKAFAERPDKAIISLKNDRKTKYQTYLDVLNEIKAAYNELQNEKALEMFGKTFDTLEEDQQKEIRKLIPRVISEAEPTNSGG